MSHVSVLSSLGGCFILIGTIMMCKETHLFERVALFWVLGGVLIIILDPNASKNGAKVSIVADLASMTINIPYILMMTTANDFKKRIDIGVIVLYGAVFNFVVAFVYSLAFEGVSFDTTDDGIWGFFAQKNLELCFLWGSVFTCFFAIQGYIIALIFYPQISVMNFHLLEPIVSQLIGVAMGVDEWPGWMTWVGVVIVMAAINVMYQGEIRRKETKSNVKEAELVDI